MEGTSQANQRLITIVGGIFSQVCALAKQKELEALKKRLEAKERTVEGPSEVARKELIGNVQAFCTKWTDR